MLADSTYDIFLEPLVRDRGVFVKKVKDTRNYYIHYSTHSAKKVA